MSTQTEFKALTKLEETVKLHEGVFDLWSKWKNSHFLSYVGEISEYETLHANSRKNQRGVNDLMIAVVLFYGTKTIQFRKNNPYIKHRLTEANLKNTIFSPYSKKLKDLVVVTKKKDPDVVITTYFLSGKPPNKKNKKKNKLTKFDNKRSTKSYKRLKNDLKNRIEQYE